MFQPDGSLVTRNIVLALLEELERRNPGLLEAVESRINSAAKAAAEGELADLQDAGRILGELQR